MICTCKGQLQPHDWLNGACPDPEESLEAARRAAHEAHLAYDDLVAAQMRRLLDGTFGRPDAD